MHSQYRFRGHLIVAAIAALGAVVAASPASAQSPARAEVHYIPANSGPPVPSGLKVICLQTPDSGAASKTCPVVTYKGITTWAYSYIDNRVSLALVSYDSSNKVVANVEKPGVRYVFEAIPSLKTQTVIFFGQARQYVIVPWSDVGPK
jgi:hypothetical protein